MPYDLSIDINRAPELKASSNITPTASTPKSNRIFLDARRIISALGQFHALGEVLHQAAVWPSGVSLGQIRPIGWHADPWPRSEAENGIAAISPGAGERGWPCSPCGPRAGRRLSYRHPVARGQGWIILSVRTSARTVVTTFRSLFLMLALSNWYFMSRVRRLKATRRGPPSDLRRA